MKSALNAIEAMHIENLDIPCIRRSHRASLHVFRVAARMRNPTGLQCCPLYS